jgi:hypothetical protein
VVTRSNDIENRFAELFLTASKRRNLYHRSGRGRNYYQYGSLIRTKPADKWKTKAKESSFTEENKTEEPRAAYRSENDKMFGGVCRRHATLK